MTKPKKTAQVDGIEKKGTEEEYVFRFPLDTRMAGGDPDRMLRDFFRDQIRDLLKIVFLSNNGQKLLPTEFGFLDKPKETFSLWEGKKPPAHKGR
jgi:hypothetical protein